MSRLPSRSLVLFPCLLGLASFLPTNHEHVVRRHDREDAAYRELAAKYPQACLVGRDGVGALIAPRWILTASHVAQDLTPFYPRVRFAKNPADEGALVEVDRVVLHPDFVMTPNSVNNDIALIRLKEPMKEIDPAGLYRKTDEHGQVVTLVGNGDTGTGESGATGNDGVWRAATNRVFEVVENRLRFRFNRPGEEGCTDLEGFWGPGDSGTPCFIDRDDTPQVVGVGSYGRSGDNGVVGGYGGVDVSFRVSHYAPWIDKVMTAHASTPTAFGEVHALEEDGFPDSIEGECAAAYFETLSSAETEMDPFFVEEFVTEASRPNADRLIWNRDRLNARRGRLEPLRWTTIDRGLAFLVRIEGDGRGLAIQLVFDGRAEPELARVRVSPAPLDD